jgi:hypothetical protein
MYQDEMKRKLIIGCEGNFVAKKKKKEKNNQLTISKYASIVAGQ